MKIDHAFLTSLMSKEHPFDYAKSGNIEDMMANYLAMSQAFPYLQAGSQKDVYYHYINNGKQIDEEFEITSVVGNFLSWDETGGLFVTLRKKMAGISEILNTKSTFHANLLKSDLETIFSHPISPQYTSITRKYLDDLFNNLANIDGVKRCATMVSFEIHANQMITSLWDSLSRICPFINKDDMKYFYTHVGGDDPAEKYHVEMTQNMIEMTAANDEKQERFIEHFNNMYTLHTTWCKDIVLHSKTAYNVSSDGLVMASDTEVMQ